MNTHDESLCGRCQRQWPNRSLRSSLTHGLDLCPTCREKLDPNDVPLWLEGTE